MVVETRSKSRNSSSDIGFKGFEENFGMQNYNEVGLSSSNLTDSALGQELNSEDTVAMGNNSGGLLNIDNLLNVEAIVHTDEGSRDFQLRLSEGDNSLQESLAGENRSELRENDGDEFGESDDIRAMLRNLMQQNNNITIKMEESTNILKKEFIKFRMELKGQVEQEIAGVRLEIEESNKKLESELKWEFNNKLKKSENFVLKEIDSSRENLKAEFNKVEARVNQFSGKFLNEQKSKDCQLLGINKQIDTQNRKLENLEVQQNELSEKINNELLDRQERVSAACTGHGISSSLSLCQQLNEPIKLSLNLTNPMEFLNKITSEFKARKLSDWNLMLSVLRNIFSNNQEASDWLEFVIKDLINFEQFRESFREKFWNKAKQAEVRNQLYFGKFRADGSMSLSQYFVKNFNVAIYLEPPLSETEIVTLISDHFDPLISRVRITDRVTSAKKFVTLLDELQSEAKHFNHNSSYGSRPCDNDNRYENNTYRRTAYHEINDTNPVQPSSIHPEQYQNFNHRKPNLNNRYYSHPNNQYNRQNTGKPLRGFVHYNNRNNSNTGVMNDRNFNPNRNTYNSTSTSEQRGQGQPAYSHSNTCNNDNRSKQVHMCSLENNSNSQPPLEIEEHQQDPNAINTISQVSALVHQLN